MPQLSGIYDSAPIQPICKIGENLSILSGRKYGHYRAKYIEPIPAGPASTIDMVANAGTITAIAANATIQRLVVATLQLNEGEFLHLRWEPIENVEGLLWELAGTQKFGSRSIHARTDRLTRQRDPNMSSTTFWILGSNHDMQLEVRNPMAYAMPMARFIFWGYRYVLEPLTFLQGNRTPDKYKSDLAKLSRCVTDDELATVREYVGTTTFVPAEGVMA